jgi:hypothetical protein
VGGERSALSYQHPGQVQGFQLLQRVLGHRVDTGRPIRQSPTQGVPRPLLTCPAGSVAVPATGHAASHSDAGKTRTTNMTTRVCARAPGDPSATLQFRPAPTSRHAADRSTSTWEGGSSDRGRPLPA